MRIQDIWVHLDAKRVLDIGAHFGEFYEEITRFKNNFDRYFAIEGNDACFENLKTIPIELYLGLVGKENTQVNFYRRKGNLSCTGSSIYRELGDAFSDEEIAIDTKEVKKLDDIFSDDDYFDFIKIDTQGSELDILRGGEKICKKASAILLEVSVHPYNQDVPLLDEVIIFMNEYGFKTTEILNESRWSHISDGFTFYKKKLRK
jgi:hypothetical protein